MKKILFVCLGIYLCSYQQAQARPNYNDEEEFVDYDVNYDDNEEYNDDEEYNSTYNNDEEYNSAYNDEWDNSTYDDNERYNLAYDDNEGYDNAIDDRSISIRRNFRNKIYQNFDNENRMHNHKNPTIVLSDSFDAICEYDQLNRVLADMVLHVIVLSIEKIDLQALNYVIECAKFLLNQEQLSQIEYDDIQHMQNSAEDIYAIIRLISRGRNAIVNPIILSKTYNFDEVLDMLNSINIEWLENIKTLYSKKSPSMTRFLNDFIERLNQLITVMNISKENYQDLIDLFEQGSKTKNAFANVHSLREIAETILTVLDETDYDSEAIQKVINLAGECTKLSDISIADEMSKLEELATLYNIAIAKYAKIDKIYRRTVLSIKNDLFLSFVQNALSQIRSSDEISDVNQSINRFSTSRSVALKQLLWDRISEIISQSEYKKRGANLDNFAADMTALREHIEN